MTQGNVKVSGEFKINADNKVDRIDNGMVNDNENNYLGSFNTYHSGDSLKVNFNDLSADVSEVAATSVNGIITELEEKYNV